MGSDAARVSIHEGRYLKRLSNLGFVFVPLSLATSFFSMNVEELPNSTTPLWVFIITTLGALILSFLIQILPSVVASARKLFQKDFHELPQNHIKLTGRFLGQSFQALPAWHPSKPEDEGLPFTETANRTVIVLRSPL
jgi:CorA-like Mg2+ transporter protein